MANRHRQIFTRNQAASVIPPKHVPLSIVLIGYMHGQGGIQTHTRFLAEGLRERGHVVRVITPQPMGTHRHEDPSQNVHVYAGLGDLIRLIRAVEPDIVVATGTGWKSMLGALAAPRRSRKVFFEVMSGARSGALDPRMLSRFGFDAVVGQGMPVTRRFVKEFKWRGPSVTIPALPEPLERQFEIPPRSPRSHSEGTRFAYFGRLEPPKNARLLIEHFAQFANERSSLDIWGTGSEAKTLADLVSERQLDNQIKICGRYPEGAAYIQLLQHYDLLLLPTIAEEGAPLVLLEAMACGLPFVANGMGGIPDYANPNCIVTSGDIRMFVPAVRLMVQRLEASDLDQIALQNHYLEYFSFERLLDRWEAFLASR